MQPKKVQLVILQTVKEETASTQESQTYKTSSKLGKVRGSAPFRRIQSHHVVQQTTSTLVTNTK